MKNKLMTILAFFLLAAAGPCWAQGYPATDSFSGSGALSSNWTNSTATGTTYVAAAQASGKAVPSVSGSASLSVYTGETFTANQYSQTVFVTHNVAGGATGPCVRMTVGGNGYCWLADSGLTMSLVNGSGNTEAITGCSVPASGDVLKLSVTGTSFTCTDVTTGVSASGTDTEFATGGPAILVDQRGSTVYALASFQADCVPTCNLGTVVTPTFSPVAGTYTSAQTVTISTSTTGATLHYTTNGTTPTAASTTYTTPISVAATETVKAIGVKTAWTNSAVGSAAYTITSSYPAMDAFSGTGALSANWTNSTATGTTYVAGAKGSGKLVPSVSGSASLSVYTGESFTANQYSQAVFVTHNVAGGATGPCVRMSVSGNGYCYIAESGITMSLTNGSGASGVISGCPVPASGDVVKLSVTGTTFTCTDVTTGTSASGTDATYATGDPSLLVDQRNSTVYALASFQADCVPTCATGGGTVATPTFSPAAGTYTSAQTVTINDTTSGATLHYTTNGTTPTAASATYTTPISVAASETVKAIGVETGWTTSAVGSAAYVINLTVATPTFSPAAGTYTSAQSVTISTTTAGATLHYTTDGTTPTAASATYSTPISVATSKTVKALGVKTGYTNSAVGSAAYVITVSGKTLSSILISPHGAVLTPGHTQQFSAVCTYTDLTTDNCANAGGATWSVSRYDASISSSGLFTQTLGTAWQPNHAYAVGALVQDGKGFLEQAAVAGTSGSSATWPVYGASDNTVGTDFVDNDYWSDLNNAGACPCGQLDGTVQWNLVGGDQDYGYAIVTAAGMSDKAQVWRQMPGDTWYQYMTPQLQGGSVAVGSTITVGSGLGAPGGQTTGLPFQDSCTWSSSNPSIATVDIHGQVTGIAPGAVTITCGRAGNGNFGTSTLGGWVSPGNTVALSIVAGGTSNTTWYVLPGGGTLYDATFNPHGECSGLVNATYASVGGTGENQACGAGNIRYLWADGNTYGLMSWKISGGDTVIVAPTAPGVGYTTGLDNFPGTWNPINCSGDTFSCGMPSIPSGTAARHTKILGANYASCHADSAKTLLHVSYTATAAFNVLDSQFVDIACFEVTDEAACSDNGNYTNTCHDSSLNYGADGIIESAYTSNVNYTDLFIHGLGQDGIAGATGVGVVADHVHIRAMPDAGINMDDIPWGTSNISVAGGLTLTNSIIEWTGCVEEYPVVHTYPYIECRDHQAGAYGDGFGTASTTGDWIFDHDTFQYNWQDGLDLLHSGMQNLSVTNSLSQANVGQAFKIGSGDNVVFRNNIAMANCYRLSVLIGDEPASALAPADYGFCRADANIVQNFTNLGTYAFQFNTLVTTNNDHAPAILECEGGWDWCNNATTEFQNNAVLNYLDNVNGASDGRTPGLFYLTAPDLINQSFFESTAMPLHNGWAIRNHNNFYNINTSWCPTPLQTGETCNTSNPMFTSQPASPISAESDLDNFNFKPATGSPLIGAGVAIPGVTLDYTGATRPGTPSIGAVE